MTTDRPDLPTFDGRDVLEHANAAAEAIRAINHITGWTGGGMTWPSDAYSVLGRLAAAAAMLPQACEQIQRQVAAWHAGAHVGIDRGTPYAGNPNAAVLAAVSALDEAGPAAGRLYAALDTATQALADAHWTDPDPAADTDGPGPYIDIVDDRPEHGGQQ